MSIRYEDYMASLPEHERVAAEALLSKLMADMEKEKQEALEAAGFRVGDAAEFLGLIPSKEREVEARLKPGGGYLMSISYEDYMASLPEYERESIEALTLKLKADIEADKRGAPEEPCGLVIPEEYRVNIRAARARAIRGNPALPLAIVGPGDCGKDTVAEWFRDHCGLRFTGGTSTVIAQEIARRRGITVEVAMANRRAERELWAAVGYELCRADSAALVRALVPTNDVIVGLRRSRELHAARLGRLVGAVLWIDRPGASDSTLEFGQLSADILIPNHRDLGYLFSRLARVAAFLGLGD